MILYELKVKAYDEKQNEYVKNVEVILANRYGEQRVLVSFGGFVEYDYELLFKNYPYQKELCIDIGGRNHKGFPNVCVSEEEMNRIFEYEMDKEVIPLMRAMNKINGIRTVESCCGHGKDPFRIYFRFNGNQQDIENNLPILLYYIDSCHVGFDWDCKVRTDCAMSPPTFYIESRSVGKQAYKEAKIIAEKIENYLGELNNKDGELNEPGQTLRAERAFLHSIQ